MTNNASVNVSRQFENFKVLTRICIENHSSVTGWQKFFHTNPSNFYLLRVTIPFMVHFNLTVCLSQNYADRCTQLRPKMKFLICVIK